MRGKKISTFDKPFGFFVERHRLYAEVDRHVVDSERIAIDLVQFSEDKSNVGRKPEAVRFRDASQGNWVFREWRTGGSLGKMVSLLK